MSKFVSGYLWTWQPETREWEYTPTAADDFGFKTEGNFVSLWVRDCDHFRFFGSGGSGCSANDTLAYPAGFARYTPSLYRIERTPNYLVANLMDQGAIIPSNMSVQRDMFNESDCHWRNFFILLDEPSAGARLLTPPLDRPVLIKRGNDAWL